MSLIDELQRRNVVRVAAAYLALGWVVTQVTGTIAPAMHLPDWTVLLVVWIGAIGFPFVVVFSWVFELTPEGLKRERDVHRDSSITHLTGRRLDYITIGFVALGVMLFAFAQFGPHRSEPVATTAESQTGAAAAPPAQTATAPAVAADELAKAADNRSIAVLPFANRSEEHKDAFFVDGIHDDILSQLAKISALKVISRTSVEQFRDTTLTMKEIAVKLGVTKILEGGVQRAGDRVRINVQLIDAGTDSHLWTETYDRELTTANIFAIQSEVAGAIANALETTLSAGEKERVATLPTGNLEAWEAYQRGKQRMAKRTSAALEESEQFFHKAIGLDANFALAHVGLADSLLLQTLYSDLPTAAGLDAAETSAKKALELDPNLAEAWASTANIVSGKQQYARADPMFRRAIELGPNNATAHQWYSINLSSQGRYRESVEQAQRAAELDPLSAIINANYAGFLELAGRFEEAEARNRKVIEIDPSLPAAYDSLGGEEAYAFNRYAEAVPLKLKAVELDSSNPGNQAALMRLYLDLGEDAKALELLETATRRWPDNAAVLFQSLIVHLVRGERAAAAVDEAQKLLASDSQSYVALLVLRNADLDKGRADAAYARYTKAFPEFLAQDAPKLSGASWTSAVDFAAVLQRMGDDRHARTLLDATKPFLSALPRLGISGYGITDAQIHALRGNTAEAIAALRAAAQAGWRSEWRYYRDFDPELASIRDNAEFKAVFADIERDMAAQRALLR